MAERSQFWDTGTTGDGMTTITQAQTTEWFRDLTTPLAGSTSGANTSQGVYRGVMNELAVSGAVSPVSIAAGAATASGFYYKNDTAVTIAIPTPAANTRIDRLVLRATYGVTREVRVTRIAGTEGAGAPAITQTAGVTWDIPLAQASITTGGVITLTDQRVFAQFATNHVKRDGDTMTGGLVIEPTAVAADNLVVRGNYANLTLVNPAQAANARRWDMLVTSGELFFQAVNDAVTAAGSWLNVKRSGTTITDVNFPTGGDTLQSGGNPVLHTGNMALRVVTGWLADSAVTAGKLAANAVTEAKILDGAVTLAKWAHPPRRQGGNATNWNTVGTTNYTPTAMRMQFGSTRTNASGDATITFPVSFSGIPLVIASAVSVTYCDYTASTTQIVFVTAQFSVSDGFAYEASDVFWLAIGPA